MKRQSTTALGKGGIMIIRIRKPNGEYDMVAGFCLQAWIDVGYVSEFYRPSEKRWVKADEGRKNPTEWFINDRREHFECQATAYAMGM